MSNYRKSLIEDGIIDKEKFYTDMTHEREERFKKGKDIFSTWVKDNKKDLEGGYNARPVYTKFYYDYHKNESMQKFLGHVRPFYIRTYHQDEQQTFQTLANMNPSKFEFDPHHYLYGGAFIYPIGAYFKVCEILKLITLNPDLNHYFRNPDDMRSMYIAGRMFIVFSIFLQAILIYLFSAKYAPKPIALLLAVIFVLLPPVSANKNLIKPHVFAPLFNIAAIMFFFKYAELNKISKKIIFFIGCLFGASGGALILNGLAGIIPFVYLLIEKNSLKNKIQNIILLGIGGIAGFIITNPYVLVSYENFYHNYEYISLYIKANSEGTWYYLTEFLFKNFTFIYPALIIIFVAMLSKYKKLNISDSEKKVILSLIIVFIFILAFFCWTGVEADHIRYFFPIIPLLFMFIGRVYGFMSEFQKRIIKVFFILALLFNFFISGQYVLDMLQDASNESHRLTAGKWINENISAGTLIGMVDNQPQDVPAFSFCNYRLFRMPSYYFSDYDASDAEYIVLTDYARRMEWYDELVTKQKKFKVEKIFGSKRYYYKTLSQLNLTVYILKKI